MKTKKRKEIKIALLWAAVILIVSLLLKPNQGKEQIIGFLIIIAATHTSLNLNGTNNLSCKTKTIKTKNKIKYIK